MKKNSTLENRLMKYSAIAGAVVAVGNTANAQIIYHDENPDAVVTGNQMGFNIDMNTDLTADYAAVTLDAASSYTTYYPGYGTLNVNVVYKAGLLAGVNGNSWMGVATTANSVAMLNNGQNIDATGVFNTNSASGGGSLALEGDVDISTLGGTPLVTNYPISQGLWAGAVDKFAGVRFTVGANTYYGWIRMSVSSDAGTVTVKDWAYNATPNTAINAGDMGAVNVAEHLDNMITVRNNNNNLTVSLIGDLKDAKVNIININGQQVAGYTAQNGLNNYTLEGLSTGMYIVSVAVAEGVVTQKIFVR